MKWGFINNVQKTYKITNLSTSIIVKHLKESHISENLKVPGVKTPSNLPNN